MRVNRFACVIALLLVHQHHTWAQRASNPTPSAEVATAGERADDSLVDFEGVYDYQQGSTIAIVAAGSKLFAVLDEARYPLRRTGPDQFVNAPGDTIPFRRGADGRVSGFVERGVFYARRTHFVDPVTMAIARAVPRPLGSNGLPRPYVYVAPPNLSDGLAVGTIAETGMDGGSLSRLVDRIVDGTYPDVHSILVYRRGRLVVEEYFYGYDTDTRHQLRSATKSIVSALVGIAVDRGALAGERELVMKRMPYGEYAHPDARKDKLTLHDLLTMRSGLACDDWDGDSPGTESKIYLSPDWVKFVLDLPMLDDPGTRGRYCSGNVKLAGRMTERATGTPLPAFAQEHLFSPLGIRPDDVQWNYRLDASNKTFSQIYLRPRDMLKLGILFLQAGQWNGRQVISREWVTQSTRRWSVVGDQDYGYFWWHQWVNAATTAGPRRVDMIVATGNGGQKIYLVPSLDAVVVMTGGSYNSNSPATKIMANDLLPALLKAGAAPSE
jgi:CubicO group peptidase (beta-lactamase class C family)